MRALCRVLEHSVSETYTIYSSGHAFKQGGSAVRRTGGALLAPLSVAVVAVLGMVFNRTRARITDQTFFLGVLQGRAARRLGALRADDTKGFANSPNALDAAVAFASDLGWDPAMSGPTPVSQHVFLVLGMLSGVGWAAS